MTDRPIYFKNSEAATIPPFACMAIVSASYEERDLIVTVRKPTSGDVASGAFVFNGPVECPEDGGGLAFADAYVSALVSGTHAPGTSLGPVAAQWYLGLAGSGFVAWCEDSEPSTNVYVVQRSGGGGGGSATIAKTPSGGIPAAVGDVPGFASCNVGEFWDNAGTIEMREKSPSEPREIYNTVQSVVGYGGRWIQIKLDVGGEIWMVDVDDCPSSGSS